MKFNPNLISMLQVAVPLHQEELKGVPFGERIKMAKEASKFLCEHGDALMFKQKGKTSKAFNRVAEGIAILSMLPGGVDLFGEHWEYREEK